MSIILKDLIKQEYKKCAKNPAYFLTKYCYIQHPMRGKVLFELYDFQNNCISEFEDHRFNIVLKGRQLGFSTLVAGYSLWLMLFHDEKNILVIATKQDTAKNLVSKVKYMHKSLPVWLRGNIIDNNKLSISFNNGSNIKAVASSKDAGRSEALSLLILDECAFIDDASIIWTAASSTLSTGGNAILISTPNGVGNFFHDMWNRAEEGENGFNPILLDWRVHPERDQAWRDDETKRLGVVMAAQEHDATFIYSGTPVVSGDILEFYKATFVTEPKSKEYADSNLWIWEYPDPAKSYIVAADVARGDGADYSTIHVIETESVTQVAEYKGKITTKDFGNLMVSVATMYNDALLIPDNSSIGWSAIQQVIDRQYRNLFYMSSDLHFIDVEHQMVDKRIISEKNLKPGFTISSRTRPLIIEKIQSYMMDHSVNIRSSRTLNEFSTFIWKNGRAEALEGKNDDLVMALGIGLWVRDTALRLRQQGIEITKISLNSVHTQVVPFSNSTVNKYQEQYTMQVGNNQTDDLRWLLS